MTASPWTDERLGRLRTLWLEGKTAAQIASDLSPGISRSAVLGKVRRMGLSVRRSAGRTRAPDTSRPQPPEALAVQPMTSAPGRAVRVGGDASRGVESGRATLGSVGRHACRWPLGDPLRADFTLCGDRVARGAYCGPHAEIAYRPAHDTPLSLERLARIN